MKVEAVILALIFSIPCITFVIQNVSVGNYHNPFKKEDEE